MNGHLEHQRQAQLLVVLFFSYHIGLGVSTFHIGLGFLQPIVMHSLSTNTTMKTNNSTPELPTNHALYECIGINPAGIYCKVSSLPLTFSCCKSLKKHIKESHAHLLPFRIENYFLDRLQSLINQARNDTNRLLYRHPTDSSIVDRWFCSNCYLCFHNKYNCTRHLERSQNCSIQDISKQRCCQLICKRYFPISMTISSQKDTSSNIIDTLDSSLPQQVIQEEINFTDIDYSQAFGDTLYRGKLRFPFAFS